VEAQAVQRSPYEEALARYTKTALKYANDVVKGRIPASIYVRQACQRHLDDLRASKKKHYPYRYDELKAGRVCFFIEQLHFWEGERAGQPFRLQPWQTWIICTIYGWVSRDTGYRRFRDAVIFVPSGNGKTPLAAALALYSTVADQEPGAQVYSVAVMHDQAKICWNHADRMLSESPEVVERFGIGQMANAIVHEETQSSFIALASEHRSLDGKNIHFAVVDEIHEHPTRDVYDKIHTFSRKRRQSLVAVISTAGHDPSSIGYEVWGDVVDMLSGERPNDKLFGVLYTIDKRDDWTTEAAWKKANPNWGISVKPDEIANEARQAAASPSKQARFKRYHLNVWTESADPWIDLAKWDECTDPTLTPEQFVKARDPQVVALDFAQVEDICSLARVFVRLLNNERHYYAFSTNYLPEATILASGNAQYEGWVEQALLTKHEGELVEHATIEQQVEQWHGESPVTEFVYDPARAGAIPQNVEQKTGATVIVWAQNAKEFTPAMQELEAAVLSGRMHHDGNELLRWAVGNVMVKPNSFDLVKPVKEHKKSHKKNDPAVAAIMAIGRASVVEVAPAEPLEFRFY
jgi:phage terminase large subunit-like protein